MRILQTALFSRDRDAPAGIYHSPVLGMESQGSAGSR